MAGVTLCLMCPYSHPEFLALKRHMSARHSVSTNKMLLLSLGFLSQAERSSLRDKLTSRLENFYLTGELDHCEQLDFFVQPRRGRDARSEDLVRLSGDGKSESGVKENTDSNCEVNPNKQAGNDSDNDFNSASFLSPESVPDSEEIIDNEVLTHTVDSTSDTIKSIQDQIEFSDEEDDVSNNKMFASEEKLLQEPFDCDSRTAPIGIEHEIQKKPWLKTINLVDKFQEQNQCRLCFSPFPDRENLEKHEDADHLLDDQESLNLEYFTLADLKFRCKLCPDIPGYLTGNLLAKHRETDHKLKTRPKETKQHECKLCYTMFSEQTGLQRHYERIHRKETHFFGQTITDTERKFKCDFEKCDLWFVSKLSKDYHSVKIHNHTKKLKCFFCPELFTRYERNSHCWKIHGKKDEMIQGKIKCMVCRKLVSKPQLGKHKRTHQKKDNDCHLCNKSVSDAWHLNKHLHKIHQKRKVRKKDNHKVLSSKPAQNYCHLCYVNFSNKGNLNVHVKKIHTVNEEDLAFGVGDRKIMLKYQCKFCKLKFLSKKILKLHIKKQCKERKNDLSCKHCNMTFKWSRYRRGIFDNHMKNIHKLNKNESEKYFSLEIK